MSLPSSVYPKPSTLEKCSFFHGSGSKYRASSPATATRISEATVTPAVQSATCQTRLCPTNFASCRITRFSRGRLNMGRHVGGGTPEPLGNLGFCVTYGETTSHLDRLSELVAVRVPRTPETP